MVLPKYEMEMTREQIDRLIRDRCGSGAPVNCVCAIILDRRLSNVAEHGIDGQDRETILEFFIEHRQLTRSEMGDLLYDLMKV